MKISDDGVYVYGTPWDGKHRLSSNCCVPLKAIVQLSRSPVNHIEPLENTEGFIVLMKQIYLPNDPGKMARIMTMVKKLLDNVDFYHLSCNMEPKAAMYVWDHIAGND